MYKEFDNLPETRLFPKLKINSVKVFALIFIVLLACFFIISFSSKRSLNRHFKITTGQINHITGPTGKNSSRGLDYEYYINERKYLSSSGTYVCDNYTISELALLVINRKFYVIYDTTNFKISNIVITIEQAEKYKININDTLRHFDSIFNCKKVSSNDY